MNKSHNKSFGYMIIMEFNLKQILNTWCHCLPSNGKLPNICCTWTCSVASTMCSVRGVTVKGNKYRSFKKWDCHQDCSLACGRWMDFLCLAAFSYDLSVFRFARILSVVTLCLRLQACVSWTVGGFRVSGWSQHDKNNSAFMKLCPRVKL